MYTESRTCHAYARTINVTTQKCYFTGQKILIFVFNGPDEIVIHTAL